MPKIDVNIDRNVFNTAYLPHLSDTARTQIFCVGSGSGKSVFLAQRAVYDLMAGGRNYLVVRQVARTLRGSVFTEICKVITEWMVSSLFAINKSDMLITCHNGYQIIFAGLDDTEKLKSLVPAKGVLTDIWIEESTETERGSIKQLYKRQRGGSGDVPKRLTMSFNPIIKTHWIYEDYFSGTAWADNQTEYHDDELSILKTWFIHNRWLTADDIRDLENETDPYYRSVYTFGNWGVLGNVIFTNWRVEDLSGMRAPFTNYRNGLDFGFSSDPAACIAELQKHNVSAGAATKGKDSVLFGIQWLQQQTIVVDTRCINTRNELSGYKWKEDKDGNAIRQPVDKNNHLIDALRYAYEGDAQDTWWFA